MSVKTKKLSRERDQRRALMKSLAEALIAHESIVTTTTKAKVLRPYVEKLVTRAKENNVHARRMLKRKLSTDSAVEKLITEIAPRYTDRPGGYLRIERDGWRRGDDAPMSRIEFVASSAEVKTDETPAADKKENAPKKDVKDEATATSKDTDKKSDKESK